MSTKNRTKEAAPRQSLPQACTLADIVVTWHDGKKEHHIEGKHVALALAMAYGRINNKGAWDSFTDPGFAAVQLQGLRQLIASTAESMDGVPVDASVAIETVLEDARIRCELAANAVDAQQYRVRLGTVERTPRVLRARTA